MKNTQMRRWVALVGLLVAGIAYAGSPHLMFTQLAASASIQPDAKHAGWAVLSLHHVNNKTTWFTDRPDRKAGVVSTLRFVQNWNQGKNSFADDHPNASLVAVDGRYGSAASKDYGVFELSQPTYHPEKQLLTYVVKPVAQGKQAAPVMKQHYMHEVALFIDHAGCTNHVWC